MGFFTRLQAKFGRGAQNAASQPLSPMQAVRAALETEPQFDQLMVYCESKYSSENPAFLMAVRHFRGLRLGDRNFVVPSKAVSAGGWIPPQHRGSEATMGAYIYDRFVDPNSDSQVNLSSDIMDELTTIARSPGRPFTLDSFAKAFSAIELMLSMNTPSGVVAPSAR